MARAAGQESCARDKIPPLTSKAAFRLLLQTHAYATDAKREEWEFAVEIRTLLSVGLTRSDLRWLVAKGYADHAQEITVPGDESRRFRSTGRALFTKRTCFVLTRSGRMFAEALCGSNGFFFKAAVAELHHEANGKTITLPYAGAPIWDGERRELRLGPALIKRFKWHAVNQETILAAFDEEGWPWRIDDPLPPQPEQDSKRRLSDTIKCLNRKQQHPLIHFRGDGTGEGVTWELVAPAEALTR